MSTIDRQQFVAQQLRALSPNSDWASAGIDRASELAAILLRVGVTDLWMLKLIPVQVPTLQWNEDGSASYVNVDGFAFDYYGRRIGYIGTPTEPANDPALQKVDQGYLLAWSAEGHGNVSYVIGSDASGTALRIVPIWGSSSDAGEIRQTALLALSFFAFVALPIVGISAGQAIGAAVLGPSLSAAYPTLTTIVGNVALSSALNGGDVKNAVENAVRSSVAGGIGSQVGGVVSLATNAPIIGSLASAATAAAIAGGDVKTAVASQLVQIGSNMSDILDYSVAVSHDPILSFDVLPPVDDGLPPIEYTIPELPPLDIPSVDILDPATIPESNNVLTLFDPVLWDPFNPANVGAGSAADYSLSPTGWDFSGTVPTAPTVAPSSNSASFNATNVVQGITNAALSAIKLVTAFQALNHPSIQTTARVVRNNGSVAVVGNNGLIQTRDSAGRVTATRPPVGVPQATLDGNYIVNNGDGSYTVVSPTGQTAKYQYSGGAASGLLTGSAGLLIGGGLLLFALARKGK